MPHFDAVRISGNQSVGSSSDTSMLADATRDGPPGKLTGERKTRNPVLLPIETHWSRILYYDLFAERTAGDTTGPVDLA